MGETDNVAARAIALGILVREEDAEMFKTVTITFRTRREMLEWLDQCSRESQCSRSSLIEMVLNNYLTDRIEKRGHLDIKQDMRKKVTALSRNIEGRDYASVILGGVRIGLPKDRQCTIVFSKDESVFKLNFADSDEEEQNASRKSVKDQ